MLECNCNYYWIFIWVAGTTYTIANISDSFQVIEVAVDGVKTNPVSFARLEEHEPNLPFPDEFTICWRSRTSFARELWSWNLIEIPYKFDMRFLAFYQVDNATYSHIYGKNNILNIF